EGLLELTNSGKKFEVIEYLKNVPSKKELKEVLSFLNISPDELVRKNEAVWKDNFKGKQLTDEEIVEAMIANPKLIERPIIIKDNKAIIGRPKELITKFLTKKN
ncbi:MAG: ArsC/Spx/MgsR family protein, partial [Eudoraea sp.]